MWTMSQNQICQSPFVWCPLRELRYCEFSLFLFSILCYGGVMVGIQFSTIIWASVHTISLTNILKKQTLVKPRVLLQRNCFLVIQMCIEYICPILNEYTELGSLLYILYIVGTWECSKRTIMLLTWHGIIKIGNYRFRVHI